jgi:hypothetical protein
VAQVAPPSAFQHFEAVVVAEAAEQQRLEARQPGFREEAAVELAVRLGQGVFIAGAGGGLHGRELVAQRGQEVGATAGEDAGRGAAFHVAPEAQHLDRLVAGDFGDARAPVTGALHQAFRLEQEEGFADGALAALEAGGQFEFEQDRARFVLPEHDLAPEGLEDRTVPPGSRESIDGRGCRRDQTRSLLASVSSYRY